MLLRFIGRQGNAESQFKQLIITDRWLDHFANDPNLAASLTTNYYESEVERNLSPRSVAVRSQKGSV